MARLKVLAIAAATGRIGCVFLIGGKLKHWAMSVKASKSPEMAANQTTKWIDEFEPEVVITEKITKRSHKGKLTKQLIAAIAKVAENRYLNDIVIPRAQNFQNKYEEAKELANQYPDILPWLPKRPRIWESEPRNMIYFEALALALEVIGRNRSTSKTA